MKKHLEKLKNQFTNNKVIIENFFSLTFLQAANYLLPLITYPYIIRIAGTEKFGILMLALATVQYILLFVDFGFDYTGTKVISINRENIKKTKEIFISIYLIKGFILIISTTIFIFLLYAIPKFKYNFQVFIFTYLMVIGNYFFPIWYFQGIEKMKYIAIINFIFKLLTTLAIFLLIKKLQHYIYVPLLISTGYLLAGLTGFYIAFMKVKPEFKIPSINKLKEYFKNSYDVFLANLGTSLYILATPLILGFISGEKAVGNYSIAEKTVRGIRYIISPLTQAIFPNFSKKFSEKEEKESIKILRKFVIYLLPLLILICLLVFLSSIVITKILTGNVDVHVNRNIKILSLIIIFGSLNNILGILGMINLNMEKSLKYIILKGGIFNLFICSILSFYLKDMGASISVVFTELLILFLIRSSLLKTRNKC